MPKLSAAEPLQIAIVNNMPDSALRATEFQFTNLVRQALAGRRAEINLYYFPEQPRGAEARDELAARYKPIAALYQRPIDALVVTGNEPKAARIDEEAYWPSIVRLADWARENTISTVWSCLAAHAVVLHDDGIARHRLPSKRSGVFAAAVAASNTLQELPDELLISHSRLNEVRHEDLEAAGYAVISRTTGGDVDIFSKSYSSEFIFFQGHPEYESTSLLREYRRDVGRFLRGENAHYPQLPQNYFDEFITEKLITLRRQHEALPSAAQLDSFPELFVPDSVTERLGRSAQAVFASWIDYVSRRADERSRLQPATTHA